MGTQLKIKLGKKSLIFKKIFLFTHRKIVCIDQATYENRKSINNTLSATHNAFNFCVSEIKKKRQQERKWRLGKKNYNNRKQ